MTLSNEVSPEANVLPGALPDARTIGVIVWLKLVLLNSLACRARRLKLASRQPGA